MKKITKILFMAVFLTFSIIINASAIKNYDVVMNINKESSLTITEKIEYEFDDLNHRGIFRDILLRKEDKKNLKKSLIKINSVTMNGEKVKYTYETFDEGLRIKIGSKDKKITQLKNVYEITYTMYTDIFKHENIQQIYFNVIPQFWKVPIEKANITIKFADGQPITSEEISRFEIYTGKAGVKEKNYKILQGNGEIKFTTQKQLEPEEGITFLLDLKTDKISPSFSDKLKIFFTTSKNLVFVLILSLASLIFMLITKLTVLKQPPKKTVVPEFEIPNDMSAMFVSYFENQDDEKRIISTGIFSLLCKDILIQRSQEKKLFEKKEKELKDKKKALKKIKKKKEQMGEQFTIPDELADNTTVSDEFTDNSFQNFSYSKLYKEEKKLFKALEKKETGFAISDQATGNITQSFLNKYSKLCHDKDFYYLFPLSVIIISYFIITSSGNVANFQPVITDILFSILCGSIVAGLVYFYRIMSGSKKFLKKNLIEKILTILKWIIIFNIISDLSNKNILITTVLILLLIVNALYSRNLKIYSEKGLRKKEYIEGLKMYIKTAEENQIKKFNSNEELVKYFKGILPYAVALNIQNEAIKLMKKTIKINSTLARNDEILKELNSLYAYSRKEEMKVEIFKKSYSSYRGGSNSSSFSGSGSGYSSGGSGYSSGSGYSGGGSGGGGGGEW